MDSAILTPRDLAILLLGYEPDDGKNRTQISVAVQDTFERMRLHLTLRLSSVGYLALLTRARDMATGECPWLAQLTITSNGMIQGFEAAAPESVTEAMDGSVLMVACLIGLLESFVGRRLTVRLLSNTWPGTMPEDNAGSKETSDG